jgi:hypothetical protein
MQAQSTVSFASPVKIQTKAPESRVKANSSTTAYPNLNQASLGADL